MPKSDGRGMLEMPVGAAGEVVPVEEDEPDDLAEGERDDGEIVAAQPEHREAEDHPPGRREDAGERQADPEAPAEIVGEEREGIGADRVEGDIAEIEEAGIADDDVQAPAEHRIGEHDDRPGPSRSGAGAGRRPSGDERQRRSATSEEEAAEDLPHRARAGTSAPNSLRPDEDRRRRRSPPPPRSSATLGRTPVEARPGSRRRWR